MIVLEASLCKEGQLVVMEGGCWQISERRDTSRLSDFLNPTEIHIIQLACPSRHMDLWQYEMNEEAEPTVASV